MFLAALADEAEDALLLLLGLERAWMAARRAAGEGRRSTSRAAAAVDAMAAAPLVSATLLAAALGMAVKNAAALLDRFRAAGAAVEVTHRSKRRLFGLAGLARLRDRIAPPRRPEPGRGRGRPPLPPVRAAGEGEGPPAPLPPLPPPPRFAWPAIDYAGLEAAMAQVDEAVRAARRALAPPASPDERAGPEKKQGELAARVARALSVGHRA